MGYARGTNEWYAKNLFFAGVCLLVAGFLSEYIGPALFETPSWWSTMGVEMELLGIVLGFVAVFVFGILLPLAE